MPTQVLTSYQLRLLTERRRTAALLRLAPGSSELSKYSPDDLVRAAMAGPYFVDLQFPQLLKDKRLSQAQTSLVSDLEKKYENDGLKRALIGLATGRRKIAAVSQYMLDEMQKNRTDNAQQIFALLLERKNTGFLFIDRNRSSKDLRVAARRLAYENPELQKALRNRFHRTPTPSAAKLFVQVSPLPAVVSFLKPNLFAWLFRRPNPSQELPILTAHLIIRLAETENQDEIKQLVQIILEKRWFGSSSYTFLEKFEWLLLIDKVQSLQGTAKNTLFELTKQRFREVRGLFLDDSEIVSLRLNEGYKVKELLRGLPSGSMQYQIRSTYGKTTRALRSAMPSLARHALSASRPHSTRYGTCTSPIFSRTAFLCM